MADFIKNLFGGQSAAQKPIVASEDADFADFASTLVPSPVSVVPVISSEILAAASATSTSTLGLGATTAAEPLRPYTKWYRVWERTQPSDFYAEMFIIPFLLIVVAVHLFGTRKNKRIAKSWITAHAPVLQQEFACLGFSNRTTRIDERSFEGKDTYIAPGIFKPRGSNEYITFATGRQNVAYVDIKLSLAKRYNPMSMLAEQAIGLMFESMPAPVERLEVTSIVFDGREADLVPPPLPKAGGESAGKREKSTSGYDGFVWAVVHKNSMQFMRDGRYDLSLTSTKDHAKLPNWSTVMSESAEITDAILTPDLISAIKQAGELLIALVISDQPIDKPLTLNDAKPKKRLSLVLRLPSDKVGPNVHADTIPLFTQFLRLPDLLVSAAHFRPEVTRRIRATRDDEIKKIKKVDDDEKSEERRLKIEKEKKKERDDRLKVMNPAEEKKFLEKERQADMRKNQKKKTVR